MSTHPVSLLRHDNYRPDATLAAVRRLLEPLGGMGRFVKPGDRVVLKPNLVYGRPPEKAVNTHPEIVAAAARLVLEAGAGSLAVGDAPGYGGARAAMKAAGLMRVVDELGLRAIEFTPLENVSQDRSFVRLELARELLEADVIINLPKFKTHGQMLMSLAVKNMFGAVPGARKLEWHFRAGRDKMLFARALNEIALAVKPHLSIMDGVLGMDGMGPGSGRPRRTAFLAAAADPWAMDAVLMDMLGLERRLLFTLADALDNGPADWADAAAVGDDPAGLRPDGWDIPELLTAQMHGRFVEKHLPRFAAWLRLRMSPPPFAKKECRLCGHCAAICPVQAIRVDGKALIIDQTACIRCYCCHELCQYDGMAMPRGGVLTRLLGIRRGG